MFELKAQIANVRKKKSLYKLTRTFKNFYTDPREQKVFIYRELIEFVLIYFNISIEILAFDDSYFRFYQVYATINIIYFFCLTLGKGLKLAGTAIVNFIPGMSFG